MNVHFKCPFQNSEGLLERKIPEEGTDQYCKD
jgi:hypothetical protein